MTKETRLQFPGEPGLVEPSRVVCPVCETRLPRDARFCPFDGEPLDGAEVVESSGDDRVGQVIDDRYEIVRRIGEGGMGKVYEVRHTKLERAFAMKVLRADLAMEADLSARFMREARAAAAVSHPNVVQITDFGSLPTGEPYFVMELLSGSPLDVVMASSGALSASTTASIGLGIAEALGAAHRVGVVHRDLKPGNVVVSGEPPAEARGVKVLDFGLAIVAGQSRLTKKGMVFGTPHYMSPEQASGDPVGEPSDMYALGVVMYQMLTGRVPFEADTFMGVMTKHLHATPTPPRGLVAMDPGRLDGIIMRCLEKEPKARYADMAELASALRDAAPTVVEESPVVTSARHSKQQVEASDLRAAGIPPRLDRRWVVGLTGAVVFLGAFVVTLLTRRPSPEPAASPEPVARSGARPPEPPPAVSAIAQPAPSAAAEAPPPERAPDTAGEAPPVVSTSQPREARRSEVKARPKKRLPKRSKSGRNMGGGMIVDPWAK